MRNQRLNAPQETHQLEPGGSGLGSSAHPRDSVGGELPDWVMSLVREAAVKVCGVAAAMLQGHSWAPVPSNGSRVNVGTILVVPDPVRVQRAGGKARRQLTRLGWGGGPVVVRGRESRPHGEGVQRGRGIAAEAGVRW